MDDPASNSEVFLAMANERLTDASNLDGEDADSGLPQGDPTFSDETAGSLLGMGEGTPSSAAAAAYRVLRAENTLERMAAQILSFIPAGQLSNKLSEIRSRITLRRPDVRAARQRAQALETREGPFNTPDTQPVDGQDVVVWFGTDRVLNLYGHFSGERAKEVVHGQCRVFVPENRNKGSLGDGFFGRLIKGDNRVKMTGVDIFDTEQFWSLLATEIGSLDHSDQQGLVFLHGYNTKFQDAARRTAQLKVDLKHKGPAGFFSWPSLGYSAGYAGDGAAIEGSELSIQDFLVDFASRSGARAVHIIAHSMGNRGLLRAMDAIAKAAASAAPLRFGQIFLAAPDVDAQTFGNLAAAYGQLSTRTTLYVTNNDKAIGISRQLHNFARVGLAPPITVVPGIDTVDASHVNLDLLGHGYAVETEALLNDMHGLILSNTAPDKRFGLRKASGGTANYWEFVQ